MSAPAGQGPEGTNDNGARQSDGPNQEALRELDASIAAWQTQREVLAKQPKAPLWLTHHSAEQHDRCSVVGCHLVCRRCLLLWPLALVVMVTTAVGSWWPEGADPVLLVLLPLPGVVEFVAEHFGWVRYNARRQLFLTIPVAVAVGRLLSRYLDDQGDGLFWIVVWGYAIAMFAAAVVGHRRSRSGTS